MLISWLALRDELNLWGHFYDTTFQAFVNVTTVTLVVTAETKTGRAIRRFVTCNRFKKIEI